MWYSVFSRHPQEKNHVSSAQGFLITEYLLFLLIYPLYYLSLSLSLAKYLGLHPFPLKHRIFLFYTPHVSLFFSFLAREYVEQKKTKVYARYLLPFAAISALQSSVVEDAYYSVMRGSKGPSNQSVWPQNRYM